MPPDSSATKQRIMEAAFREFAAYGLAGARIDRIAENARANKRAIYAYFGNKDQLFDLVLMNELALGAETVPTRWDDLPGYAGELFDYLTSDPDRIRLNTWRQLERPEASAPEVETYRQKLADFTKARPDGETLESVDLLAIVWAITNAWFLAFSALRQTAAENPWDPARLAVHRDAVVETTRRVLTPSPEQA